jgi:hypothetical protein
VNDYCWQFWPKIPLLTRRNPLSCVRTFASLHVIKACLHVLDFSLRWQICAMLFLMLCYAPICERRKKSSPNDRADVRFRFWNITSHHQNLSNLILLDSTRSAASASSYVIVFFVLGFFAIALQVSRAQTGFSFHICRYHCLKDGQTMHRDKNGFLGGMVISTPLPSLGSVFHSCY